QVRDPDEQALRAHQARRRLTPRLLVGVDEDLLALLPQLLDGLRHRRGRGDLELDPGLRNGSVLWPLIRAEGRISRLAERPERKRLDALEVVGVVVAGSELVEGQTDRPGPEVERGLRILPDRAEPGDEGDIHSDRVITPDLWRTRSLRDGLRGAATAPGPQRSPWRRTTGFPRSGRRGRASVCGPAA